MFTELVTGIASRLLLSFHSIAMTKNLWQVQGCHGAESFKTTRSSVSKEIASTTPQVWLVAGSHLGFAKKSFHSIASDKKCRQVLSQVTKLACERQSKKNSSQIIFSKIKVRLKLSCKSVGQGRGSLEGTVRPSQLKALSLLHRKILANSKTCYGEGKALSEVFFLFDDL